MDPSNRPVTTLQIAVLVMQAALSNPKITPPRCTNARVKFAQASFRLAEAMLSEFDRRESIRTSTSPRGKL